MLRGVAGLYFLEPYDPRKTPVLFVHGVSGTPRDFRFLIEGLNGRLFQPWVYCYPSGIHLDTIAAHLDQTLRQLQGRYADRELLVAHSAGGLVSRSLIFRQAAIAAGPRIPLFISIASPWDGVIVARLGAEYAPEPVWVWYDLVPDGEFLTGLFYERTAGAQRRLPAETAHHLIVAAEPGDASDGTVSVTSQLRREAREDAAAVYVMDQSHTSVLRDAHTSALVNRLLAEGRPPATQEARLVGAEPPAPFDAGSGSPARWPLTP
jgi:pimeloyl-ACP methyl ester carboxylesterase